MSKAMPTYEIWVGSSAYQPQHTHVSQSGTGPVVDGVAGKVIILIAAKIVCDDAADVQWLSGDDALEGANGFASQGQGYVLPPNPHGWTKTAPGADLNLASNAQVDGMITYLLVDAADVA